MGIPVSGLIFPEGVLIIGGTTETPYWVDAIPKKNDKNAVSRDVNIVAEDCQRMDKDKVTILQRTQRLSKTTVLNEIEKLFKRWKAYGFNDFCHISIYYSGYGEKGTGNWCFNDGVVSLEEILELMKECKVKQGIKIYSDCSYSGNWAQKMAKCYDKDNMSVRILAASYPDQRAQDTDKGGAFTRYMFNYERGIFKNMKWCDNLAGNELRYKRGSETI